MAYGDENDFGWCNIIVKFLLFLTNLIIWLVGMALLGIGIYVQVETAIDSLGLSGLLSNPAIVMIILGAILFLLGFCGCFGALLELFPLLVIYAAVLSLIVLAEIGVVVYVILQQEQAYGQVEVVLRSNIENYYNNINLRDIVDLIQGQLLICCGVTSPDDWQANIYFNCSSIAFQRCSVPFSCCMLDEGEVVNVQCGYRTLDSTSDRFRMGIYTEGCLDRIRGLVQSNIYIVGGVGIGVLVFELLNILLAAGLAIDVRKEKAAAKAFKHRQKQLHSH